MSGVHDWLETRKPAASERSHLLMAAVLWGAVGTMLLYTGANWALRDPAPYTLWILLLALALGVAKAAWVLRRAAIRITARIRARGDGRCIGGFLSVRTWLIVVGMMLMGRWLRRGTIPPEVVGFVYVGVGTALLFASRHLWSAWWSQERCADAE